MQLTTYIFLHQRGWYRVSVSIESLSAGVINRSSKVGVETNSKATFMGPMPAPAAGMIPASMKSYIHSLSGKTETENWVLCGVALNEVCNFRIGWIRHQLLSRQRICCLADCSCHVVDVSPWSAFSIFFQLGGRVVKTEDEDKEVPKRPRADQDRMGFFVESSGCRERVALFYTVL